MNKKWIFPILMAGVLYVGNANASMSPEQWQPIRAEMVSSEITLQSLQADELLLKPYTPQPHELQLALARSCDSPWYVMSGIELITCMLKNALS